MAYWHSHVQPLQAFPQRVVSFFSAKVCFFCAFAFYSTVSLLQTSPPMAFYHRL
ncbi:hypothetical protein HanPSC8_Chr17g0787261 [Helianthus annuus]|nr:hypothetical protein HanPSC8_Chr17g0787261 [Helianthus annuus]